MLRRVAQHMTASDTRGCAQQPAPKGVALQSAAVAGEPAVRDLMAGWTTLAPADREAFDRDGFLVVKGALSQQQVAALAAAGDHLDAHFADYWDSRGQGRNLIAVDPDNFLPMLTHPATLPLVAQLMGPRLQLHTSQFLWNKPNNIGPDSPHADGTDPTRLGWHRDIAEMTSVIGLGESTALSPPPLIFSHDTEKSLWRRSDASRRDQVHVLPLRLRQAGPRPDVGSLGLAQVAARRQWAVSGC